MAESLAQALRVVLVTPEGGSAAALQELVEQCLDGGVSAVLWRRRLREAQDHRGLLPRLRAVTREHAAALLVSGDIALAAQVEADGIHLGYGAPSVSAARSTLAKLGSSMWVGRSAHWPLAEQDLLADYFTLSPFAITHRSHPRPLLTLDQVRRVLAEPDCPPVVALGGLTADVIPSLPDGLAGVAVIRALTEASDRPDAAGCLAAAVTARWFEHESDTAC